MTERLDVILTGLGLAKSRSAAQKLIKLGDVTVNGKVVRKASELYCRETDIFSVREDSEVLKYVGRGGLKLEAAIKEFGIDLCGMTCLDIGASTGGFTDCMLQSGAKKVFAVDVGRDQLDERLRRDSRVISLEQLDIRDAVGEITEKVGFISVDVSFISLKLVLPELKRFAAERAECVALIKPQFENGAKRNGKHGVIKEPAVHKRIVDDICCFAETAGFRGIKTMPSPVLGGDGNKEFLMYGEIG